MKSPISLALALVFLMGLLTPYEAGAQQTNADGVFYIIQSGDTLSTIASRFGLTVDQIVAANDLINPDQISAGTQIKLPGVDWVRGVLDTRLVNFGETMRTLSRRYEVTFPTFSRLNGAVSPGQLFVGYPAMLPTETGEFLAGDRAVLATEETSLELTAAAGMNVWMVAGQNRVAGTARMLAGDVLILPGTTGTGPGALPSPISRLSLEPLPLVQGKTTVIRASAAGEPLTLSGALVDRPLTFYTQDIGELVALQGVHAMLPTGLYPFAIEGTLADGSGFSYSQLIAVQSGGYESESLTVDVDYLDDPQSQSENEFVAEVIAPHSLIKLWDGFFVLPTPYGDTINSYFGTRRSYNDSPFDYFHTGVDWGGGLGTPVLAPAHGVVVFAGELVVRGNATIIDHGWGVYTGYWHQEEILVQVGDEVVPGQTIGMVGTTGRSTGAHLHWEVWVSGVQVEPLDWLFRTYP
ncbi:MAG: LysM peptidoglycan-binding domain-containing protein [Anaerolineae bacterium]|nr:MAG: LysM peptidoglycan-binding domain-containing protein [Anaerolineae bacterium]